MVKNKICIIAALCVSQLIFAPSNIFAAECHLEQQQINDAIDRYITEQRDYGRDPSYTGACAFLKSQAHLMCNGNSISESAKNDLCPKIDRTSFESKSAE